MTIDPTGLGYAPYPPAEAGIVICEFPPCPREAVNRTRFTVMRPERWGSPSSKAVKMIVSVDSCDTHEPSLPGWLLIGGAWGNDCEDRITERIGNG